MSEPILNTLTHRLDRLERDNRRLKLGGAFLVLALVSVGAMGQVLPKAVPKVVEAERFVLRDTKGKILAALGTRSSGTVLFLYDQNGKARAGLSLLADGSPGLVLADQNGKERATLIVLADGSPSLSLADQNGKTRAGLSLLADGLPLPSLVLADQNEKSRAVLTVGADGSPHLGLFDQNEKPRADLSVGTSGPSLVLLDENRNRAVLGHTALEGKATGTVEQRPASSLVLFDRDGKVIWRAP